MIKCLFASILPLVGSFLGGCAGLILAGAGALSSNPTAVASGCVLGLFAGYAAARFLSKVGDRRRFRRSSRAVDVAVLLTAAAIFLALGATSHQPGLIYMGLFGVAASLVPAPADFTPGGVIALAGGLRVVSALVIFLGLSVAAALQTGDRSWLWIGAAAVLALCAVFALRCQRRDPA